MFIFRILILLSCYSLSDCSHPDENDYDDYGEDASGSSFINDKSKLWKDGKIKYKFRDDEHNGGNYTENEKTIIRNVMRRMETQLGPDCIKFIELNSSEHSSACLKFDKESHACRARIGNSNSYATMGLPGCFNNETILHEMGHVLGLIHEQNRPDRDEYVEILWDALTFSARTNMRPKKKRFGETYETPYDYLSVMHYPDTMGSSNSQICIRVKEPYKQFFIAEGKELIQNYPDELSPVDVYEISAAYNCSLNKTSVEKYVHYVKNITTAKVKGESCKKFCTPYCSTIVGNKEKRLEFFGGFLYYFHLEAVKYLWSEAEQYCNQFFDVHLTSIHSQQEFDFITKRLEELEKVLVWSKDPYWSGAFFIGGQHVNGDWKWTDKTDMDWPELYNKWLPGEPSNYRKKEDKLEISINGVKRQQVGLNDVDDYRRFYSRTFVCKLPCI